ncbi:MAG: rhomboid family intramembrane serine protease [Chlamydiales bacterium]|nr:rhomboid family intramembrane serine protease [Chlamydiales bacterium]
MQGSSFFTGPHKTSRSVRVLIWITVVLSLLSPIATFLLNHYLHILGPSQWFALSRWGLERGWLWQPLTYFFIHSDGIGISLWLLISLFFHMFLLWFTGSEIEQRFGARSFILFYLSAGLIAGIFSAGALLLFSGRSIVVGSGPAVYALVMLWVMFYPDLELYFFFLIRIKAKWLVGLFLSIALLISLSYGRFTPFFADLVGICWGFAIGRIVWKLPNPYSLNLELPKRRKKRSRSEKIIDISVMQESDDAFMDRMLDKIASKGEESLTRRERERMKKISERKNQK